MSNPLSEFSLQPFSEEYLDQMVRLIDTGRCALILGPHCAGVDDQGKKIPLRAALAHELAKQLAATNDVVLPDQYDLPMICTAYMGLPGASRLDLEMKVEKFYRRFTEPGDVLRIIPHIPFRIILTVSPDNLLQLAYKKEGRLWQEGYYRMGETQTDDYDNNSSLPYIYQLFGKIREKDSEGLVLTQEDQMRYIDSVQGVGKETRLPTALRSALLRCKGFLFVGFDFEYWYLRVLLHILQFKQAADKVFGLHQSLTNVLPPTTHIFYKQQYKFTFLDTGPVQLLDALRSRFEQNTAVDAPKQSLTLLYLHAEEDTPFYQELDRHLTGLKEKFNIRSTSIQQIPAGSVVEEARAEAVDQANLIIPVVTANFTATDWLGIDLSRRALARHGHGQVRVVAVYASEVFGGTDQFDGKVPVLPAADMPVSDYGSPDKACQKIAQELEKIIEGML